MVGLTLWWHPSGQGVLPHCPEREHRLRVNDCAALGGLLCDLLTGARWRWLVRALDARPYCSAHHALTGDGAVDAALSAVLNRAWRGDDGGAPLVANDGRGDQDVYDDPRELLADAAAALGIPLTPEAADGAGAGTPKS